MATEPEEYEGEWLGPARVASPAERRERSDRKAESDSKLPALRAERMLPRSRRVVVGEVYSLALLAEPYER